MQRSRRHLLRIAALAPAALLAGGASAAAAACYDPTALPLSQKNRRRSLGYVEASGDGKRRCGLCAMFTASQGACGACQLLDGAPVNAVGLCDNFAPRG